MESLRSLVECYTCQNSKLAKGALLRALQQDECINELYPGTFLHLSRVYQMPLLLMLLTRQPVDVDLIHAALDNPLIDLSVVDSQVCASSLHMSVKLGLASVVRRLSAMMTPVELNLLDVGGRSAYAAYVDGAHPRDWYSAHRPDYANVYLPLMQHPAVKVVAGPDTRLGVLISLAGENYALQTDEQRRTSKKIVELFVSKATYDLHTLNRSTRALTRSTDDAFMSPIDAAIAYPACITNGLLRHLLDIAARVSSRMLCNVPSGADKWRQASQPLSFAATRSHAPHVMSLLLEYADVRDDLCTPIETADGINMPLAQALVIIDAVDLLQLLFQSTTDRGVNARTSEEGISLLKYARRVRSRACALLMQSYEVSTRLRITPIDEREADKKVGRSASPKKGRKPKKKQPIRIIGHVFKCC